MFNKTVIPILIFIFIAVFSLIWSWHLIVYEWRTDYGHHYYISMNNASTSLYKDFFTHKGPVLIIVFDFFEKIFSLKSNYKDSLIMLFLLCFTYLLIVFLIFKNLSKSNIISILILIYTLLFFRDQTSDIFVDLILNSILILSFFFFLKFLELKFFNVSYLVLSLCFFLTAILTRVDTVIYGLSFIILAIYFYLNEISFFSKKNYRFLCQLTISSLSIYLIISLIYSFSFLEFFNQNITFNLKYAEDDFNKLKNLGNLYAFMPTKVFAYILFLKIFFYLYFLSRSYNQLSYKILFSLISFSQFLIFIYKLDNIVLFFGIFLLEIFIILYLLYFKHLKLKIFLFILIINFFSLFIFLYSGSSKLNHGMILYNGTVFLVYFILKEIFSNEIKYRKLLKLIIIILFIYQSEKIYRSTIVPVLNSKYFDKNISFSEMYFKSEIIENNKLILKLKKNNFPIICDRGWLRVFSDTKSFGILFDWWFWDIRKNISTEKHDDYFENLKQKKFGNFYLIDQFCTENNYFGKNLKLKNLINNSTKLEEYSIFDKNYFLYTFNY